MIPLNGLLTGIRWRDDLFLFTWFCYVVWNQHRMTILIAVLTWILAPQPFASLLLQVKKEVICQEH